MNGWMDKRVGWIVGWKDEWMNEWTNGRVGRWMEVCVYGWMGG
jgi:hypothetical protein